MCGLRSMACSASPGYDNLSLRSFVDQRRQQNFTKASHGHARPAEHEMGRSRMQTPLQGGGWQLAEQGAIFGCETAKIVEPVVPCDLRDAGRLGVSARQGAMHQRHSTEAKVAVRAHA